MIIRKCDRCKKEITEGAGAPNPFETLGAEIRGALGYRTDKDYTFKVARYLKYDTSVIVPDGILDLCPACSKSLFKWFYNTEEAKANDK